MSTPTILCTGVDQSDVPPQALRYRGECAMKLPRRSFLHLAAGGVALSATSRIARAQVYPARPVTLIVPFAAGGPSDTYARVVTRQMGRIIGQQFVIENVGGAGGTTGVIRAMRAKGDGYTILLGNVGTHAHSVALIPNLPYKPELDFEPLGLVIETPNILVARRDFPAKDLRELMSYVKENAAKLNVGHAGVGSISYTNGLWFNMLLGVRPTFVPFTGTAPAATALLAGQIDFMIGSISDFGPHIQSGTIRAYASASAERSHALPDVPTTREAGLPEFQTGSWWALFAPKGTPQSVLDKLSAVLDEALDDDTVRKRFAELGSDGLLRAKRGQQSLAAFVKSEIARWAPIIKAANVKAE